MRLIKDVSRVESCHVSRKEVVDELMNPCDDQKLSRQCVDFVSE